MAVCGHSGSGKSSLLAVMSGIDMPTEGNVTINDINLYSMSRSGLARFRNENIGIIFQNFNLIDGLTAKENIEIPQLLAAKNKRKKTDPQHLLELVGLVDKANTPVENLSCGEQQRIAIARAVMQMPCVIFADEPTGSLDYENSIIVLELFQRIRKEMNTSVVIVTHEKYVAQTADKIIRLKYGKIENS